MSMARNIHRARNRSSQRRDLKTGVGGWCCSGLSWTSVSVSGGIWALVCIISCFGLGWCWGRKIEGDEGVYIFGMSNVYVYLYAVYSVCRMPYGYVVYIWRYGGIYEL